MIKITQEFIDSGKSHAGGWSREQLRILGVSWPPEAGWRERIEGTEILTLEAEKFIEIRNNHLKGRNKRKLTKIRKYGRKINPNL